MVCRYDQPAGIAWKDGKMTSCEIKSILGHPPLGDKLRTHLPLSLCGKDTYSLF